MIIRQMKTNNFLVLVILVSAFTQPQSALSQINEGPIIPSSPTDVFIVEKTTYEAPENGNRPIVRFSGLIYWERLSNLGLYLFINTSDVILEKFWDYDQGIPFEKTEECYDNYRTVNQLKYCLSSRSDSFFIIPGARSFAYQITAYYTPDIIHDTGFIVIFNSQTVDFSLNVDGKETYAKVDYKNVITLPIGTAPISYAPIENGQPILDRIVTKDGLRWQLTWEYKHRAMDSKHDPLLIEITYSYDPIYLKFIELVYQSQQDQEDQDEQKSRLELLNLSFRLLATLALVASIFAALMAFLIVRRKYRSKLERAIGMPRRSVSDIEKSDSEKITLGSALKRL